jgi:nickel superoxide dismutase
MRMIAERLAAWIRPTRVVHAHCDLPCGVYDPAQARIEAESMAKIVEKYHASDDEVFRDRAILIKEQRAELVKHHLWVLWTDYFKPQHLEQFPNLHDLFWQATKAAGQAKHSVDPADQQKVLDLIGEIDDVFQKSKSAEETRTAGPRGPAESCRWDQGWPAACPVVGKIRGWCCQHMPVLL